MTAREPQEMAQVAAETGVKKTHRNRPLAGAGNLIGAALFGATSSWCLFLRDQPDTAVAPEEPAERA